MTLYRRKRPDGERAAEWTVQVNLGRTRYTLNTGTRDRRRAERMQGMLKTLWAERRTTVLRRLKDRSLRLADVFPLFARGDGSLQAHLDTVEAALAHQARPTLGALVEEYEAWLASGPVSRRSRRRLSPATAARYAASLRQLVEHEGAGWRRSDPACFTAAWCERYRRDRMQAGASPATINRDLLALSGFLGWIARVHGLLVPRPDLVRERESPGRDRWLTADELARVRTAFAALNGGTSQLVSRRAGGRVVEGILPTAAWWPLFETLVHTGMRLGEALALEWADVRFTEGVIRVERGMTAGRVKSYASVRKVPLSTPLAGILATHRAAFAALPGPRVFPPLAFKARRLQMLFSRAVREAGIEHARVHDLRHTFAVHALEAGVPVNALQAILGHSDAQMVLRYVRRQSEGVTARVGDVVAASLAGEDRREESAAAAAARQQLRRA